MGANGPATIITNDSEAVVTEQPAGRGVLGLAGRMRAELTSGRVIAADDTGILVLTPTGRHVRASRAAACLLDPEPGDKALLFQDGREAYVLSVLEKAQPAATLSFAGDVSLRSAGKASVVGKEAEFAAVSGTFRFVELSIGAKSLQLRLDKVVCLARVVQSTVESLVQRLRYSFRQVTATETVRAGAIRQFIEDRFFQRSRNVAILADEKIKMDGDKIELG